MNLKELRTQFIKLSGRYDLVVNVTDYADNGADFHIQAGQKYLSKLVKVPENESSNYYPLGANEYSIQFEQPVRSIESVFINSASERWELTKAPLKDIKSAYYRSDETSEAPSHYAVASMRSIEPDAANDLGTFINLIRDGDDADYSVRGLVIVPPADQAYTIEVNGKFEQKKLTLDSDKNWWSEEHPSLLIMAAMRNVEIFHRNREGVADWDASLAAEITLLERDAVEEEVADIDQMEG